MSLALWLRQLNCQSVWQFTRNRHMHCRLECRTVCYVTCHFKIAVTIILLEIFCLMSAKQLWCVQLYKAVVPAFVLFLVLFRGFCLKLSSTRHLQSMPNIIATNLESVVILSSSFHWHPIHILDSEVQSLCYGCSQSQDGWCNRI